ncbi:MAG TPA: TIGR03936 family radical SAM-associated protein, partial [Candidatus Eisenbacteria bacterium]|nr:TIGR03936 family radical SAM-associated protein [Candidatus Eisenbacteria bacterium]
GIKFYFMIGLPTETEADVDGIANIIGKCQQWAKGGNKRMHFNVGISPHVPKPHTPFQWEIQDSMETLNRKIERLRQGFRGMNNVRLKWRDPDTAFLEGVFSRGDARTADALEAAWRMGARFDGWSECFNFGLWLKAFEQVGIDPSVYLRPRDLDEVLPWDHIRTPVVKKFLLNEMAKAYAAALTPDCRDHACYRCGAPCFTPKARDGRRVSLQLAPGQGQVPETLDFRVPDDVTPQMIEHRVEELRQAPIEALKAEPAAPEPKAEATNGNGSAGKAPAESPVYGRRRKAWPTSAKGPQAQRFRVTYEKLGQARFTSHLDLVRIFDRALRVAKIPMAFSQGFNRHAKIAYGPPLSLGATSRAEYFDLELAQPCPWPTIESMNDVLPEGIRIQGGRPFTRQTESLMAAITQADYEVRLTGYLMDLLSRGENVHRVRQELEQGVTAFREAAEWPVMKQSHGQKGKTVNARPAVIAIALDAGPTPLCVRVSSRLHAPGYVRPDLLLKSLFQSFEFDPRLLLVHREALWVERGGTVLNPLDVLEESSFWRPV